MLLNRGAKSEIAANSETPGAEIGTAIENWQPMYKFMSAICTELELNKASKVAKQNHRLSI